MITAIIPARGGSKRIPKKNIKNFCGRPMISYAISAAKESNIFDRIIVSTDDVETADIARFYGADVPFIRPSNLSDDYTGIASVVKHSISKLGSSLNQEDLICCIFPCVPLIDTLDIKEALSLLRSTSNAAFSFPIAEFESPIQRGLFRKENGLLNSISPEFESFRTQDLEPAFHDVGQFYWGCVASWMDIEDIHNNSVGLIIPKWRSVDVDTIEDWQKAEFIFRGINKFEIGSKSINI